jgi:hypothetical protein
MKLVQVMDICGLGSQEFILAEYQSQCQGWVSCLGLLITHALYKKTLVSRYTIPEVVEDTVLLEFTDIEKTLYVLSDKDKGITGLSLNYSNTWFIEEQKALCCFTPPNDAMERRKTKTLTEIRATRIYSLKASFWNTKWNHTNISWRKLSDKMLNGFRKRKEILLQQNSNKLMIIVWYELILKYDIILDLQTKETSLIHTSM